MPSLNTTRYGHRSGMSALIPIRLPAHTSIWNNQIMSDSPSRSLTARAPCGETGRRADRAQRSTKPPIRPAAPAPPDRRRRRHLEAAEQMVAVARHGNEGRGDEISAIMLSVRRPRFLETRSATVQAISPRCALRPDVLLRGDAARPPRPRHRPRSRRGSRTSTRSLSRCFDRPGVPRAGCTTPRRRDQDPVPLYRPGRPRRPQEPRPDPADRPQLAPGVDFAALLARSASGWARARLPAEAANPFRRRALRGPPFVVVPAVIESCAAERVSRPRFVSGCRNEISRPPPGRPRSLGRSSTASTAAGMYRLGQFLGRPPPRHH